MSIAGNTVIDEVFKDETKVAEVVRDAQPDSESADEEANKLLRYAQERGLHDSLFYIENKYRIPVVVISTNKFILYNIILGEGIKLTGSLSLEIFEFIIQRVGSSDKKVILIYYSKKGNILRSAYLFLGYLIEKYHIGILFVNGSITEVFDIIESLLKKGEFKPEEEDYVELKEFTV